MIYKRDRMIEDPRSEVHGGTGSATLTYLIERNIHPNLRLLTYMSVAPGATIGLHHHRLETEYYLLLKGSVTVDDNGTRDTLGAGDLLQTGSGQYHALQNPSSETAELLVFVVTHSGHPLNTPSSASLPPSPKEPNMSMYQAFIPGAVRTLENGIEILGKIAAHAEAKKIDPSVFFNARLAPDMFPLSRQVQIASDTVKGGVARLAGEEPPKYEDSEASFADLAARLRKTADYLKSFKPAQIDGSEDRPIAIKMRAGELNFNGLTYLTGFVLPNLYFHITTTYLIARHNGVELGKKDFLGKLD